MKLPLADNRLVIKKTRILLRSEMLNFIVIIFLQICAALTSIALPWLMGVVVDHIVAGTTRHWVMMIMAIALASVCVSAAFTFISEYQARVLGERIFARIREDLVRSVTHLPLSVVEGAGTGDLIGRTTHDVESVQNLIRNGLSAILVVVTSLVVTVVASVATSPILGLFIILELPCMYFLMRWYVPRTVPSYRARSAAWAELSGAANETLEQAVTVDHSNLGHLREARLLGIVRELWRLDRYGAFMRVFLLGILTFISLMPILIIALIGAWLAPYGFVTMGAVSSIALYAYRLRGPLVELTFWVDEIQTSQAALSRIFGVELVEPDRTSSGEDPSDTTIRLHDVHYSYREAGDNDVLKGINLELRKGETLAIVGPSGAGKSTLGRMLAGIHPPTSGSVTVGGINLVDLPENELHSNVVLVTQEHYVFVGTIADNLRLAFPEASEESMWDALRAVGADEWVRGMDDGLDTQVGSNNVVVTPARAQQIALARIVLIDPHTLVLDEATSLIDPTAARSLERSLARVLEGRTVIAIAHRLYTAHDADRVAVMIDGQIIEMGSHDDLVALGGEYASLWHAWHSD